MLINHSLIARQNCLFGLLRDESRMDQAWHKAHEVDCLVGAQYLFRQVFD